MTYGSLCAMFGSVGAVDALSLATSPDAAVRSRLDSYEPKLRSSSLGSNEEVESSLCSTEMERPRLASFSSSASCWEWRRFLLFEIDFGRSFPSTLPLRDGLWPFWLWPRLRLWLMLWLRLRLRLSILSVIWSSISRCLVLSGLCELWQLSTPPHQHALGTPAGAGELWKRRLG